MERKDIYSSLHAIYDTLQYLTTRPIDTLFFLILRALKFFFVLREISYPEEFVGITSYRTPAEWRRPRADDFVN